MAVIEGTVLRSENHQCLYLKTPKALVGEKKK